MKKVLVILLSVVFIFLVVFISISQCMAEEMHFDFDLDFDLYQYQAQVSGGGGSGETTIYSYIQPLTGTEFLPAPRVVYLPHKELPWYEVPKFRLEELYPLEKVLKLAKKHGDIIQAEGFCMRIKDNQDPAWLLPEKPGGKNDIKLWAVMLETPANGFLDEAVRRVVSIGKAKTNTRRIFVEVELQLNPRNAGHVLPFGSGSSFINNGKTAWAFAANPQTGESESRIHNIWQVTVYCYNNGPVPPFSALAKAETKATKVKSAINKKGAPSLVFFGRNGLDPNDKVQRAAITKNVQWLEKRWQLIHKKGFKVEFVGLGLHGLEQTRNMTREGMIAVGSTLYTKGYKEEDLENTFRYRSQVVNNPKLIQDLKERKKSGVIVMKITTGQIGRK